MKLNKEQKKKISICGRCEFARQLLGNITCGTPIIGDTIKHRGKDVKLCGCVMKLKVLVTDAECPIESWQ